MTRPTVRLALLALLAIACAGCTTPPPISSWHRSDALRYLVIRHAEKSSDDAKDPSLSEAGQSRARALADALANVELVAVYATPYRRTQQTAAPTAQAHRLPVIAYDAKQPAAAFVAQLRERHKSGTVLVVGHSNTVPEIVGALCTCPVAPIGERAYGDLFDVRIDERGNAALEQRRY